VESSVDLTEDSDILAVGKQYFTSLKSLKQPTLHQNLWNRSATSTVVQKLAYDQIGVIIKHLQNKYSAQSRLKTLISKQTLN
jgi:hypothetical protein